MARANTKDSNIILSIEVTPPPGYEDDKEESTFECIKFRRIKKELPKTWEEFYENKASYKDAFDDYLNTKYYFSNEFESFVQLKALMKVYNNGWIPNWNDGSGKFVIYFRLGKPVKTSSIVDQYFLAFKNYEIRNKFYDNFKDLIIQAKPFL